MNKINSILPAYIQIQLLNFKLHKKFLNLKEPKTFNEKIQWLKLYWRNDLARICADKYEVRQYVEKK